VKLVVTTGCGVVGIGSGLAGQFGGAQKSTTTLHHHLVKKKKKRSLVIPRL
jgi:hypothetical protein